MDNLLDDLGGGTMLFNPGTVVTVGCAVSTVLDRDFGGVPSSFSSGTMGMLFR
jgi:hypothetical protein